MKKTILFSFLLTLSIPLIAQHNHDDKPHNGGPIDVRANYQVALYDLFGGGFVFKDSLVPIFPDTTVIVEYSDTNSNTTHNRPSVHGLVSIYDPTSELFGNNPISGTENYFCGFSPVNLDSVMTYGKFIMNDTTHAGRLRFDVIVNTPNSLPLLPIRKNLDVDADGTIDSLSIVSVQIIGDSNSQAYSPFNITSNTTVYRDLTIQDTGSTKLFISALSNITIPAQGIAAVVITYEPDTGSYTPFSDTIFLGKKKGINSYNALIHSNKMKTDSNLYWLQFSTITSLFYNFNNVTGYISTANRYDSDTTSTAIHSNLSHQSFFRASGNNSCGFTTYESRLLDSQTNIFPNPNNGSFYIQLKNYSGKDEFTLSLSTLYGQEVYTNTLEMGNGIKAIDTDNLEAGVYLLTIDNGKEAAIKRIVIE